MKTRMSCVLVVLALVTISFAQKPHEITMGIVANPTSVKVDNPLEIQLAVMNTGSKSVTIREVDLYCGTSDHRIWEKVATYNRVTVSGGEICHFTVTYTPSCNELVSCAGDWSLQGWMCFGGSGKSDLMTPLIPFTVTE